MDSVSYATILGVHIQAASFVGFQKLALGFQVISEHTATGWPAMDPVSYMTVARGALEASIYWPPSFRLSVLAFGFSSQK